MNFGFSSGLEYRYGKNGTAILTSVGTCNDKHIIVPEFIDGKTVTEVDERAFSRSDRILSITLPHTVSRIGKEAFAWCRKLELVKASGIIEIGDKAFIGCDSLTDIGIGSKIKKLGKKAFAYCISLTTAELPNSIYDIGASVFEGCSSLATVSLPESMKIIPSGIFYACVNLSKVGLPTSLKYIDEFSFAYCCSLEPMKLSRETVINQNAFFESSAKKAS